MVKKLAKTNSPEVWQMVREVWQMVWDVNRQQQIHSLAGETTPLPVETTPLPLPPVIPRDVSALLGVYGQWEWVKEN
jgi:hypothetical protein